MKKWIQRIKPHHYVAFLGVGCAIAALLFLIGDGLTGAWEANFYYGDGWKGIWEDGIYRFSSAYSFIFGTMLRATIHGSEGTIHVVETQLSQRSAMALASWLLAVGSLVGSCVGLALSQRSARNGAMALDASGITMVVAGILFFFVQESALRCFVSQANLSEPDINLAVSLWSVRLGMGFLMAGVLGVVSGLLFFFSSLLGLVGRDTEAPTR